MTRLLLLSTVSLGVLTDNIDRFEVSAQHRAIKSEDNWTRLLSYEKCSYIHRGYFSFSVGRWKKKRVELKMLRFHFNQFLSKLEGIRGFYFIFIFDVGQNIEKYIFRWFRAWEVFLANFSNFLELHSHQRIFSLIIFIYRFLPETFSRKLIFLHPQLEDSCGKNFSNTYSYRLKRIQKLLLRKFGEDGVEISTNAKSSELFPWIIVFNLSSYLKSFINSIIQVKGSRFSIRIAKTNRRSRFFSRNSNNYK